MADTKISSLTAVTTPLGSDELVLARAATTNKITATNLRSSVRTQGYCKIVDSKAEATSGGTFTSGAWRTRDLNTIQWDDDSLIVSLAANQFVLVAGTYDCSIRLPSYNCFRNRARLYNITDASVVVVGASGSYSSPNANDSNDAFIFNRFTIAASKTLEIQHVCETTSITNGFGAPIGSVFATGPEIYAEAEFWKIG
jgi:hypothetical protein